MTTRASHGEPPPAELETPSPAARRARRLGWWFYVVVCVVAPFALLLTAAVGVFLWWKLADAKAAHEVALEVARIQAAGEPVTIYDLYQWHRVPEGTSDTTALWLAALQTTNAISVANTKFAAVPIVGTSDRDTLVADHAESTVPLAEEFLQANDGAVQAVLAAASKRGQCRLPVAFEAGVAAMSSAQQVRGAARLMSLRMRVSLERGNTKTAVESVEANLALAQAIDHQPTLVDQLVRIAIVGVTLEDIELLLNKVELTDEQLAHLQAEVQSLDLQSSFTTALQGDRGCGFHGFHQFPPAAAPPVATVADPMAGGKLTRPADCRFYLELMQQYIDASRRPFPAALDESKHVAARVQAVAQSRNPLERMRYFLSLQIAPGMDAAFEASARGQALRDLTVLAIACERHRLRHGDFPPDSRALSEMLPAFPNDPYDGQPLRMKVVDGEMVLYSVGKDGVDNGGQDPDNRMQPDVVVRLAVPQTTAEPKK